MKKLAIFLLAVVAVACKPNEQIIRNELRAPAYPLVTIDPFTSTWSAADKLYDAPTTHWTGAEHQMLGVIVVDGTPYRFLGQAGAKLLEHVEEIRVPALQFCKGGNSGCGNFRFHFHFHCYLLTTV